MINEQLPNGQNLQDRKKDHIDLALKMSSGLKHDSRFYYEPLHSKHPSNIGQEFIFLNKKMKAPLWISSMTGGTELAWKINSRLAKACKIFGLGMGLGSCRPILENEKCIKDFDVRGVAGDDCPLYANLGIAQLEHFVFKKNDLRPLEVLVQKLNADGLIIHVNPLQEWLQPQGDRLEYVPIETLKVFTESFKYPVIVKEVGQGIGPEGLKALMKLNINAIEFAAFGGTNFSQIELQRRASQKMHQWPLVNVGHTLDEMCYLVNQIFSSEQSEIKCKQIIVSGGIKSFLDGHYYINSLPCPSIYGQAREFLRFAIEGERELFSFIEEQVQGLSMAKSFLKIKK